MRKLRLGDVLFYASLLALPACDIHHEENVFASRAEHGVQIDRCLNEDKCLDLCDGLIPPEDQGDFYDIERCEIVSETPDGVNVEIEWSETVNCGRRPIGFIESAQRAGAAGWLATVARLESASITAFERLAAALAGLGAPQRFIARARFAIEDERRHTRAIGRLARMLGAHVEPPAIVEGEASLLALAVDNAVEGQVGETIGALVAACQARAASPPLRAMFASIARDEARHAELAHDLAPWFEAQLDRGDRAIVRAARREAIERRGGADAGFGLDDRERAWLGIPPAKRQARANAAMFAMLIA